MPVRTLGGDAERDARRLFEQLANPAAEHLVGVGRPLALMQDFEPGFDREGLDEASAVGDVLIDSPRIGAVALSRISKLVDRAQELGPVVGVDPIFENPPRIMPPAESHSALPSSDSRLLNESQYNRFSTAHRTSRSAL